MIENLPLSVGSGTEPVSETPTFDPSEVERFARLAAEWWDPNGKFRPLHQIGPARLAFLRDRLTEHFRYTGTPPDAPRGAHLGATTMRPLSGLAILDIGCGGGLVAEPLCRMGARVTGIDPSTENIGTARAHSAPQGLAIDYRAARVEDLVAAGERFDAVTCLEVLEHIPDPAAFLAMAAKLIRPGGLMLVSTINRTPKSYALAIVAAEYVFGWLPRGTHQWERFIAPDELAGHLAAAGLTDTRFEGIVYDPLRDRWSLSPDTGVNYVAAASRPG